MILSSLIMPVLCCIASTASGLNPFGQALRNLKLTPNQSVYHKCLRGGSERCEGSSIVICTGPAGTGKTSIGVLHALNMLKTKQTSQIILTRPTVLVDSDNFGALPGDIQSKMDPLLQHISDVVGQATASVVADTYTLTKHNAVKVIPLEYTRGLTFHDSFVLCDEAQNSTPRQMKALLTRIGHNTTLVVSGDLDQSDISGENGLQHFLDRYKSSTQDKSGIIHIQLTDDDIMRSELVKQVLSIYS